MILRLILEWSRIFQCAFNTSFTTDDPELPMAKRLVEEEWKELQEALLEGNEKEIRKEYADLLWVVIRLGLTLGAPIEKDITAVYDSNMSKIATTLNDAPDNYHSTIETSYGTIYLREDGKILKPKCYRPAIIS
jgi:NTP pyrophosphatase (non-canonical NTP hydrolase)